MIAVELRRDLCDEVLISIFMVHGVLLRVKRRSFTTCRNCEKFVLLAHIITHTEQ